MIAVVIPAGFDRLHPRLSEASGVLGLGLVLGLVWAWFWFGFGLGVDERIVTISNATYVSPQMTFSFSSLLPGPNLFIKNLNRM